jgi:hypothetical protein
MRIYGERYMVQYAPVMHCNKEKFEQTKFTSMPLSDRVCTHFNCYMLSAESHSRDAKCKHVCDYKRFVRLPRQQTVIHSILASCNLYIYNCIGLIFTSAVI